MTPEQHIENVDASASMIRAALGNLAPGVAVVLGSGLGGLAGRIEAQAKIPYRDLPGFPVLSVQGHAGEVIAGRLGGAPVIALSGRKHFYEGADPYALKTMIRAMKGAGVKTLLLSNAAGSLRGHIGVSELMLITDHINLMGFNPLTGPNDDAFGPRFFPMGDAWDWAAREKIKEAAQKSGIRLHEGVYAGVLGPSFETPAEIRMMQGLGADAVGMSTVPECLVARHCGLKVAGISCITNMGAGLSDEHLSHSHTLENAGRGSAAFEALVAAALPRL